MRCETPKRAFNDHRKQPHKTFLKSNKFISVARRDWVLRLRRSTKCARLASRVKSWPHAHTVRTNLCSTIKTDLTKISWLIVCVWAHSLLATTSISLSPRNYNSSSWCWWEMGWCACMREGEDVWCDVEAFTRTLAILRSTAYWCLCLHFASLWRLARSDYFGRQLWFRAMIRFSFTSFVPFPLHPRFASSAPNTKHTNFDTLTSVYQLGRPLFGFYSPWPKSQVKKIVIVASLVQFTFLFLLYKFSGGGVYFAWYNFEYLIATATNYGIVKRLKWIDPQSFCIIITTFSSQGCQY